MAEVLPYGQSGPSLNYEGSVMESESSQDFKSTAEGPLVNLHIRTQMDSNVSEGYSSVCEEDEEARAGALVMHSGGDLTPKGADQPQDQLTELLQELGMIETQQEKLRDAVRHNKGIVVHPRHEALEESESEYGDTPKAPTPKKKLIVSGGLTGFGIAHDLLQIDFSPPEEAPEEFKAVAFYEEPKEIKPGLSGNFGLCDPASKEMHHYLERLEEQQKLVLELITGKKQALIEHITTKDSLQGGKQGGRIRNKSRLGRTGRLEETANKTAMADALGLSAHDKELSLSSKLGSMAVGSKGALSAKLPLVAASHTSSRPPVRQQVPLPRPIPSQVRQQQPAVRKAEVQKGHTEAKEHQEMLAQFAKPMPGTTPSTSHLASKAGAKQSHAAAIAAAEAASEANPYYSSTPQKQSSTPQKPAATVSSTPRGRVSNLGSAEGNDAEARVSAPGAPDLKPKMFSGLRRLMKSKSKA